MGVLLDQGSSGCWIIQLLARVQHPLPACQSLGVIPPSHTPEASLFPEGNSPTTSSEDGKRSVQDFVCHPLATNHDGVYDLTGFNTQVSQTQPSVEKFYGLLITADNS